MLFARAVRCTHLVTVARPATASPRAALLCSLSTKTDAKKIVPVHHPNPRLLVDLAMADGVKPLMRIFEEKGDEYGWITATDTIKRVTKSLIKSTARFGAPRFAAESAAVTQDPQFERLMAIPTLALEQNVMDSKARMGHSTDDLSSLKQSLVVLKLTDTRLYELLEAKLAEELEEEDEPGEFGHDFQGGSVGF